MIKEKIKGCVYATLSQKKKYIAKMYKKKFSFKHEAVGTIEMLYEVSKPPILVFKTLDGVKISFREIHQKSLYIPREGYVIITNGTKYTISENKKIKVTFVRGFLEEYLSYEVSKSQPTYVILDIEEIK